MRIADNENMRAPLLIGILFLASSCSSVSSVRTGERRNPKPDNCEIAAYSPASVPQKPYTEVCLINARMSVSSFSSGGDKAIARAKEEACKCGADAIIIDALYSEGDGFVTSKYGTAQVRAIAF